MTGQRSWAGAGGRGRERLVLTADPLALASGETGERGKGKGGRKER